MTASPCMITDLQPQVHERSIDSDFLLIILKSLLARRANLRVILMSATVDADKVGAIVIITVSLGH